VLALGVGVIAIIVAINLDMLGYETFLFLIGGVFVPVFGIFLADYFVLRRGRCDIDDFYLEGGRFSYIGGFNIAAIAVWAGGFFVYAFAGQPPWLLEHADFVSWVPTWWTHVGGTIPALAFSFAGYTLIGQALSLAGEPAAVAPGTAPAEAG
jgi:cytosine/uracil/thiamine/allantoin permease